MFCRESELWHHMYNYLGSITKMSWVYMDDKKLAYYEKRVSSRMCIFFLLCRRCLLEGWCCPQTLGEPESNAWASELQWILHTQSFGNVDNVSWSLTKSRSHSILEAEPFMGGLLLCFRPPGWRWPHGWRQQCRAELDHCPLKPLGLER